MPLRPLAVGEILDGAISGIRANPKVMLGLSAIVVTITQITQAVVTWWALRGSDTALLGGNGAPLNGDALDRLLSAGATTFGITTAITTLARLVLTGILTVVVSRLVIAHPVTLREAWRMVVPRLLPLLALTVLSGLVTALIFAAGVVPGLILLLATRSGPAGGLLMALGLIVACVCAVYVWVTFFGLASPALVLEKQGPFAAMARSRVLTRHNWWRVFGILLLAVVLAGFIGAIIQTPFSLATTGGSMFSGQRSLFVSSLGGLLVAAIGGIVAGTITQPFSAGVSALLYIDQRMRREGLDIELARAARSGPATPTAAGPPGDGQAQRAGQPPASW